MFNLKVASVSKISNLTLWFYVITILITPVIVEASERKLNIMFISSFGKEIPAQSSFEKGLNRILKYKEGKHNLFFEFMDSPQIKHNFDSVYFEYLKNKYKTRILIL
jgi:hypothetical protein